MDTFGHYIGTSANLVDFLAVPAQPAEEYGQRVNLYEIQMEPGLLLNHLHIHKNPWRLYVNNSTYYARTSDY